MYLNTIQADEGSRKKRTRVGRGIGSGLGKTAGLGHKGQRARAGGYHKVGFEGGQMPLQRRLPKFGFTSRKQLTHAELRLTDLNHVDAEVVDLAALIKANVVNSATLTAKVFLSGEVKKPVTLKGIKATKGAKAAIEAAGGKIVEA